jgi:hypothetical protein
VVVVVVVVVKSPAVWLAGGGGWGRWRGYLTEECAGVEEERDSYGVVRLVVGEPVRRWGILFLGCV